MKRFTCPPLAPTGASQGGLHLDPVLYPCARRSDAIDSLHGVTVADPYRWLEDPDSAETAAFNAAQNAVTAGILAQCQTREPFYGLLTKLSNYPRTYCPFKEGKRYYFFANTGLQAHWVLYSKADLCLDSEAEEVLNPNTWGNNGGDPLWEYEFSKDGAFIAYSKSSGGSDWQTVEVVSIDAQSGKASKMQDALHHIRFTQMAWTADNKGFFYSRPRHARDSNESTALMSTVLGQKLYYHVLGSAEDQDMLVFDTLEHPDWWIASATSHDGRYLMMTLSQGCEPAERLYLVDLDIVPCNTETGSLNFNGFKHGPNAKGTELPVIKLVDNFDGQYEYVTNTGSIFTFRTNHAAPLGRVVRIDVSRVFGTSSEESWSVVISEHNADLLKWARIFKDGVLLVCWLRDAKTEIGIYNSETGELRCPLPLPGIGSVQVLHGQAQDNVIHLSFTSCTLPSQIYRADLSWQQPELELWQKNKLTTEYDLSTLETHQECYTSKDGSQVSMLIVGAADAMSNGSCPTLLSGYGGFNHIMEPAFSPTILAWILAYGGKYAFAHVRGDGAHGIAWRDAGSLHNKQNVFDDFAAAAEHLIAQGITTSSKLVIEGQSNGGLLVAACANQRPDLCSVVLSQGGVSDMLRFQKFTGGKMWMTDYGNPEVEDDFQHLLAYSPVHNVRLPDKDLAQYPAIMLSFADHDDRVVPMHSQKLLAALQHMAKSRGSCQKNPLLGRIRSKAGHGLGMPLDEVMLEAADMYGFAAEVVGAQWMLPSYF